MNNCKTKNNSNHSKHLIALACLSALSPSTVQALDLAQSPPGTVEPYVAPNVIISIDDSGSMGFRLDKGNTSDATNNTTPTCSSVNSKEECIWPTSSRRMNVLKHALTQVFNDKTLLDDKKIRLGWQSMWNNGNNISKYNDLSYWYGGNVENPGKNQTPGANNVGTANSLAKNNIKILDSTHRSNFLDFVKYLLPNNGTPSHAMFKQADEYLRKKTNGNPVAGGPWSTIPGDSNNTEYLGCRKNYHIMLTDGRWNGDKSGGNKESSDLILPDGTSYTANSQHTKVYYDNYSNTLSDWAFYSWSDNLQPNLYDSNNPKKQVPQTSEYRKADATEKIGTIDLPKYWNPKYNPATWPHLVTYTIGFSDEAITWPGASSIVKPTSSTPFGYDGSFPDLVAGNKQWPDMNSGENVRALDLWHAAINGRGRFYAVSKGEDLEAAFREIIGTINAQAEPDRSSVAISGTSAERKPVGTFITFNEPKEAWRGGIKSFIVSNAGQTAAWDGKSTAEILDDGITIPGNRTILTWNDTNQRGAPFRWVSDSSNMSQAQKDLLSKTSSTTSDLRGEDRLNYIRGDRSTESSADGNFRIRKSRQGDIVNSVVWYTGSPVSSYNLKGYNNFINKYQKRRPIVYVGGNDGMLHGFSASDGQEVIAYVPRGSYEHLSKLSWKSFDDNHKYFVDGSPMTGDLDTANRSDANYEPQWKTYLIGSMGGGGKGYFVLDVTKAGTDDEAHNFSESNAASLVIMDKTMSPSEWSTCTGDTCLEAEADIGHIFSTPSTDETNPLKTNQITLLNNNRWGVIMGNGYNSANQRPVLLIQYLDGDKELLRIPATKETPCTQTQIDAPNSIENTCRNTMDNGLSAPRLVDINGDGRPDIVYAGDIQGNLWKFFIGSKSSSNWGVAFDGKPLFTATGGTQGSPDSRTKRQPITAAPTVRTNDRSYITGAGNSQKTLRVGGMMVSFGSGRNVTTADPSNTDVQTLYSVLDNSRYVITTDADDKKNYVSIHLGDSENLIPSPTPIGIGSSNLAQQKVNTSTKYIGEKASLNRDFWSMDTNASTTLNWNIHKGWYMDFPETGERLLKPLDLYDGSNILAVYSQVPAKGTNARADVESCESTTVDAERQYLTLINIMDGQRPSVQLMDLNGDGIYDTTADKYVSRQKIEKGAHTRIVDGKHIKDIGKAEEFNLARMPEQSMRPSWRQLK